MSNESTGYYRLLDVSRDATLDEIKSAFRKLAHKFHPDKNPDDKDSEEMFKEICRAYEVLADPRARSFYDRTGIEDVNKFGRGDFTGNPFGGFGGFPGRGIGRGCGFGRGCGRRFHNNMQGNFVRDNITVQDISITEEQAKRGIEVSVKPENILSDKLYKIKLPAGIQSGTLFRCVDEENGNDFIIRINYN